MTLRIGQGGWTRTSDHQTPNLGLYQAELRPERPLLQVLATGEFNIGTTDMVSLTTKGAALVVLSTTDATARAHSWMNGLTARLLRMGEAFLKGQLATLNGAFAHMLPPFGLLGLPIRSPLWQP